MLEQSIETADALVILVAPSWGLLPLEGTWSLLSAWAWCSGCAGSQGWVFDSVANATMDA